MSDHEPPDANLPRADASDAGIAALSALAHSLAPIEPEPSARARLLAALRGPERFTLFSLEVARSFGLSEDAALAALRAAGDEAAWHHDPRAGGGSWVTTPELRAAQVVIARLPAGSVIPRHAHDGRELTFVLDGLLIEDGQRACGPGTLLDPGIGSEHELVVGADKPCTVVFHPVAL